MPRMPIVIFRETAVAGTILFLAPSFEEHGASLPSFGSLGEPNNIERSNVARADRRACSANLESWMSIAAQKAAIAHAL